MPVGPRPIALAIMGSALLAVACAHAPASAYRGDTTAAQMSRGFGSEVREGVARVRAATAPFHVLDSAVAAGYAAHVHACLDNLPQGAMGFHHANRDYTDSVLVVEQPEILVYERLADGSYQLNGVEYIVPYRFWSRNAAAAPRIFGQELKRADGLQIWYLHVWAWKENPSGLFADWNPNVRCPAS